MKNYSKTAITILLLCLMLVTTVDAAMTSTTPAASGTDIIQISDNSLVTEQPAAANVPLADADTIEDEKNPATTYYTIVGAMLACFVAFYIFLSFKTKKGKKKAK
jgi:hypothetical protein